MVGARLYIFYISKSQANDTHADVTEDDDIVMVGADDDPTAAEKNREHKRKPKVIFDKLPTDSPAAAEPVSFGIQEPSRTPRKRIPLARETHANARKLEQSKNEDDIVMVDGDGPSENVGQAGLKRSDSSAKKITAGLGGMFGGLLSKSRPEPKRRSTYLTDDEGARGLRREDRKVQREGRTPSGGDANSADGPITDADVMMTAAGADEDREARRAARRARRAEREAADKAAEEAQREKEARRERRRKREEEAMEARRQEEKEARRAARREQRAKEEADRQDEEAREAERAERRRARREQREREARMDTEGEDAARARKSDRRRSQADAPEDDEERRQRREERRALRAAEAAKADRRKSAPVMDKYSRDAVPRYMPAEGRVYKDRESRHRKEKGAWPHSGTDSWVKDHSDAPPPPEDGPVADAPLGEDTTADEDARRRLRRTRHGAEYDEEEEQRRRNRRARRREREGETVRSSEGSQPENRSRRDSGFVDTSRPPSVQGRGGWWKKITG